MSLKDYPSVLAAFNNRQLDLTLELVEFERKNLPQSRSLHTLEFLAMLGLNKPNAWEFYNDEYVIEDEMYVFSRKSLITPYVKNKDFLLAAKLQKLIVNARPHSADELCSYISLLSRGKELREALGVLELSNQEVRRDKAVLNQYFLLLIKMKNYYYAVKLVNEYKGELLLSPKLSYLGLLSLIRGEKIDAAIMFAEEIDFFHIEDAKLLADFMQQLLIIKQFSLVDTLCKYCAKKGLENAWTLTISAQLLCHEGSDLEQADDYLRRALCLDAKSFKANALYGELLLSQGKFSQAVIFLERAVDVKPLASQTRMLLARAYRHSQNYLAAAEQMSVVAEQKPNDKQCLRQAAAYLLQAGDVNKASELFQKQIAFRSEGLTDNLSQQLQNLWDKTDSVMGLKEQLDWAWAFTHKAGGKNAADKEAWTKEAKWGVLADQLLLDWLECRPKDLQQALDLMVDLNEEENVFREALKESKGLLLLSAHVGPLYAGPLTFQKVKLPHKYVASTPSIAKMEYAKHLISASDQTEVQVSKKILSALNRKEIVIIAIDGIMNPAAPKEEFHGQKVTYSPFASKIAYKLGTPSMFAAPYWHSSNRIGISLTPLPTPEKFETVDEFSDRWKKAYFECLDNYLIQFGAMNLRLKGGIWRDIR